MRTKDLEKLVADEIKKFRAMPQNQKNKYWDKLYPLLNELKKKEKQIEKRKKNR